MIILPKDKPVVRHLNSYYLNVARLIEHYQGELGTGVIHFKSAAAEGAVFFDEENIINVTFQDSSSPVDGVSARDRLIDALKIDNFYVSVYRIDEFKVFFWANLSAANDLYQNLTTEFTDLKGLIKKMAAEKLTGYIDVDFQEQSKHGQVFFFDGVIIGVSCSWLPDAQQNSAEKIASLIRQSKRQSAVFHARTLDLDKLRRANLPQKTPSKIPLPTLLMIHDLISTVEMQVRKSKRTQTAFQTLLRKKFIEKADIYDFLDPFAAEFKFTPEKVEFEGDAPPDLLVRGVLVCIRELAHDLDLLGILQTVLDSWFERYAKELSDLGVDRRAI